jgi:hypothetical protein
MTRDRSLLPRAPRPGFTILLVADSPPADTSRRGDAESPAARHEALTSLARAVFAAGGRMVLPADDDVALLVGTVALDYAQPAVAERRGEASPSPLIVMETGEPEHPARALLAPLAVRGALRYLDAEGSEVDLDLGTRPADRDGSAEVRPRRGITPALIQVASPVAAVFISPARGALLDWGVLREHQVPVLVFRDSILEAGVAAEFGDAEDPTPRLLGDTQGDRWSGRRRDDSFQPAAPYAYLMQRIVEEWAPRG